MPSDRRFGREPNAAALLRLAERADLLDEPTVPKLLQVAATAENTRLKRQVANVLTMKALQRQAHPFDGAVPSVAQEQVMLGMTLTGSRYAVQQDQLTQHLLTVGQSGTGKTTLFYNLMEQLSVPFWSFDLKQDYRHLLHHRDDLLVLPWTELKFNPLQPPAGVRPRRWAQVFAEIFGHATSLLSGSKNYLMKQLVKLYQLYGLLDEVEPPYPSLVDLQLLIERDKINYVRKTANYRDTVENRFAAMNRTAGCIFNCSQGYPIDDLLQRNVVFEFDGLSEDTQNFLMEILIAYVYEHRMAQNQRGDSLRHAFFMDEGKRVFSVYKERQDAAGLPAIDELTGKMREFGEGLIVADQEASKLTDSIKANTYTKVLLPTGDQKQFAAMTESMNLSDRQKEVTQTLGIGEAVIQVGNNPPVPVKLDPYDLEKTVTDADLRELQADKWDQLAFEERELTPEYELAVGFSPSGDVDEPEPRDTSSDGISVSEAAKRLLEDVVEYPGKPLMERYDLFANVRKGNEAKTDLVDEGVVIERHVHTQAGQTKLLELTEKGRTYVQEELGHDPRQEGRGSAEHQYWQYTIKQAFEAMGWPATIEHHDADVFVDLDAVALAVEVALGDNPREIEHVEKHLDNGLHVWVACRNTEIRDGLRQRLEELDGASDRVRFTLLTDFSDPESLPL